MADFMQALFEGVDSALRGLFNHGSREKGLFCTDGRVFRQQ
jgi:hypothetical protein